MAGSLVYKKWKKEKFCPNLLINKKKNRGKKALYPKKSIEEEADLTVVIVIITGINLQLRKITTKSIGKNIKSTTIRDPDLDITINLTLKTTEISKSIEKEMRVRIQHDMLKGAI